MKKNFVFCILIAALALGSIGCRQRVSPTNPVGVVPAYENVSLKNIRDAILQGGTAAGWQMRDETDGRISATYTIRTHSAIVSIPYDNKEYKILYQSSVNLKAKDGTIHPNYNKWVDRLNRYIASALQQLRSK